MAFLTYLTNREKRKRLWGYIKVNAAHHPHCVNYEKHVYMVKGVAVCRGCTVYYPTALLSFVLIWLVPSEFFSRSVLMLTLIGFLFVIPSILHASQIGRKIGIERKISLLSRISFGMGMGYAIRYILVVSIIFKILAILGIMGLYGLTTFVRYKTYWSECEGCPFVQDRLDFEHCPGLAPLNNFTNPQMVKYFEIRSQLRSQSEDQVSQSEKKDMIISKP